MPTESAFSLTESILKCRCPHCRKGDLFRSAGHYDLKRMLDMPKQCAVCNQPFEIEPGFWLGALWVSYPIVIFIIIAVTAIAFLFLKLNIFWSFMAAALVLLCILPPLIRLSRSVYIHIFVPYEKQ